MFRVVFSSKFLSYRMHQKWKNTQTYHGNHKNVLIFFQSINQVNSFDYEWTWKNDMWNDIVFFQCINQVNSSDYNEYIIVRRCTIIVPLSAGANHEFLHENSKFTNFFTKMLNSKLTKIQNNYQSLHRKLRKFSIMLKYKKVFCGRNKQIASL